MKLIATCLCRPISKWVFFILNLILLTLISSISYGQSKIFATNATVKATQVDNPTNATNASNSFATVRSYSGFPLGIGKYSGELELRFDTPLPANTTTYVRINFDTDVLNALLGGNLGGLLADVLGNVILGDHYFEVGARNTSGTNVLSGTSSGSFTTANIRLVKDANGFFYLALTPSAIYDRIYVKDVTNSLLSGTTNTTQVYNAFYISGSDPCANAFATNFEGSGLTVDALGLGKAGVTNMERAIDADENSFSEISLGALGVAGSISQNIYFATPSNPGDEFNIKLQTTQALANAGLLNNISVTAYNGNSAVFTQNISNILTLDLLGLLNNGQPATIPFAPNTTFDRVQVTLNSILNVNLTQTINLYSVTRSAARPTFVAPSSNAVSICYNTQANLTATTLAANELRWYEAQTGGAAVATVAYNAAFTTPALTANKTYYVAARRIGCTTESIRVPVVVTVNPLLTLPTTTLANSSVGKAYSTQLNPPTGGTAPYTYAMSSGSSLPNGLIISSAGQIGGTPTISGDFTFSIVTTDAKGCTATNTYTLKVTPILTLPALTLPNGTVSVVYPNQVLPAATGGSTPYVYTASNLPPGLTFNATTREITGTPTQAGNFVVTINVADADGNTTSGNYNLTIKNALALPTVALAQGTVGVVYPPQTILAATGGTAPYVYSASNLPPGLTFNATTREITGTPTQAGTYNTTINVSDADGSTATANYTIVIENPLLLANQTLANGTIGTTYATATLPAATGGTGPYTYAATNIPPGLNFNATTREITGTPTQAGNYTINLTVTDANNRTASNTYPITVVGTLSLPTATLANGTVGVAYPTQTLPNASGGTGPYTYVVNNLPPGLSFNTTTKEITGTPTTGGTYIISQTATNTNGNGVNTDYTIVINVAAPIIANATVCSGTFATLNVTNVQPGVTYNLYASTGNTPIQTNTTGIFNTPVLTNTTTFYVEAVSGTAVSARVPVTVNINPTPDQPTIITNSPVINSGQNVILQATATAGNTINWYATATGGTALASGPSFTTPNLTATTTYYAESVNTNGCVSATRTPVTITVVNNPGGQACNTANSQNSGITGICLLCNIAGPGNSTDADKNNYTRITLAVGAAATGYQRLIFPTTGVATDSIRLDLATPVGLLDLALLNDITVSVMNGTTVVSSYQLNSGLINLQLLSNNRFTATLLAGGVYDRVEVRFGATVTALTSLDIYGAEIIYPKPTVSASGQSICSGSTTTLNAVPNGGTTLAWYSAATGGTLLATGNSYNTPALTTTTTYYIEISKAGCPNLERVPVTVTVTPVISAPVIANAATGCAGSATLLSVTNPDPSLAYNWYTAATGGSPIFTGATFTTPVLTTNVIYYVEAASAGCVSATRSAVNITVGPRPVLPQVQVSSSTVQSGQTAVLTATSSENNVTFDWYATSTGGAPVYTGPTFVTPPLTATTSYYVETRNTTTGCTSSSRIQVTITVDGSVTPINVPCEAAIAETNGVTGVALLARVANPTLAIDDNTQTSSTLVMPVGALGASVYQRLAFPSLSNVGDTIRVLLTSPDKLLSAGVLSNVLVTTYNGATSNNDGVALNNNLINLELLNGSTQALVTFVPTNPFDAVEIRLNSGVLGALASIGVNYAQHVIAKPQVVASDVTACNSQTVVLTVQNPKAGLTYKWYDAAGTYLAGQDGTTFTTPAITANTRFFVAASSATGCISNKTAVNVTLVPPPTVPQLLSNNVNTCSGNNVTLQVQNPVAGTTYRWYNGAGVYQAGQDGITFTVNNVTTSSTYSVEAVNTCGTASTRTIATINVGVVDVPVIVPAAVTVSSGSPAVLTATSSTVGTIFNWYDSPSSTTILFTGSTYVTGPLTNTTTIYVEAIAPGACPASARASVTVTVIPNNDPENVPCGSATVALADGVTGVALLARVANPGLAVDDKVQTASSLIMPVGALGASVYQRVGFTGGLSNVGDTLRLRITSPGKLLSLGVLSSVTVATYQGATTNNDETAITNNSLINLELASDNSFAIITLVPTSRFDGVELRLNSGLLGALTSVDFNYAQRIVPKAAIDVTTTTVCAGTSATLAVRNPQAGVTYRWYVNNVYQTGKDGVTFSTDPALAAGTYNVDVRATVNGCESLPTVVAITILPTPLPPVASPTNSTSACVNAPVTLMVNAVAGVSFNWYDANGNLLVINNNSYTLPTNLAAGTYNFFVEARNGNACSNATRTPISITINPVAVANDIQITGNTSICGTATVTLTATSATVTNPVFTWYTDAALTNVAFVGPSFATPLLNSTTTYYVTVSGNGVCANAPENSAQVTIVVNPSAVASDINVSGNSTVCAGSIVTLTASSTTVTNPIFSWYTDAGLTNKVFEGNVFTSNQLTNDVTYYVTVRGDNRCENAPGTAKVINVNVNQRTTSADININGQISICQGSAATLNASSVTVANPIFSWYTDVALTNKVFEGATFTTPALNVTTLYYVTIKGSNVCETQAADAKIVTVTVKEYAKSSDINLNNTNVCAGSSATLMASSFTVTNPIFNWYSDASLTNLIFTGPTFTTPALSNTTQYFVIVRGDNKCENMPVDAKVVTVSVNSVSGTADILVIGNTSTCSGTTVVLTASSPTVTNPIFTWYADAALTNLAFVGSVFTTPALAVNTTYYVTVRGDNKCENSPVNAKVVAVTVNQTPQNPVVSTTGTNICAGSATTLTIQNAQTGVTYEWYDMAAGGTLVNTGTTFNTTVLNTTTDYYVQAIGAGNCLNPNGRIRVTVTVVPRPTAPTVTSANVNVCNGGTATLSVSNPQAGVTYNWYTSAVGGTSVFSGNSFVIPSVTANAVYYVEASSGSCNSSSRTQVNIMVQPVPTAPTSISSTGANCSGSIATLSVDNPDANLIYRWYANSTGGTMLAEGNTFTTPSLATTTTYYVESVAKTGGCSSNTRTPVTVNITPILASPVVRVQSSNASSITFAWNAVQDAIAYEVSLDGGNTWVNTTGGALGTTYTIMGLQPGQNVTINVRAKGATACQTSANSSLTATSNNPMGNNLYVPNTFTPNGDGKNDIFYAYGSAVAKYSMRVYNQWGEFLFQALDINRGWDGTYRGSLQPNGVYVYYIDVTFNDGTNKIIKGTVTLLR